jgi:hypothetical protein
MKHPFIWALLIAAIILLLIASVSAANETNYSLTVYSEPTGNLTIGNITYGLTPQTIVLTPAIYLINVSADGFWPNATSLNLSTNTTINLTLSPINTTNTTNTTNQTTTNITILQTTPGNKAFFSADDTLPTSVTVVYNGSLDINKSKIELLHNGENKSWIILRHEPGNRFSFQLDQQPDGIYTGNWTLISNDNTTSNYQYEFSIITTQPDKVYNIAPEPGHYKTDTVTLQAEANGTNLTVQWLISDGFPSATSSKWKSLSQTSNLYSEDINFENAEVGAVYLKVLDQAGNFRIQPTGIVSAPSFEIDFDRTSLEVFKDEIAEFEFQVIRKDINKKKLRCKLEDLIKDKGTSKQQIINTNGKATLLHGSDEADLMTDYEETLDIGSSRTTTIELVYETPAIIPIGDYEGTIECLIAK